MWKGASESKPSQGEQYSCDWRYAKVWNVHLGDDFQYRDDGDHDDDDDGKCIVGNADDDDDGACIAQESEGESPRAAKVYARSQTGKPHCQGMILSRA